MPYRSAPLRLPEARLRPASWRALLAVGVVALGVAGWRAERSRQRRAWELGAGARRAAAEGAGMLASYSHAVWVLHGEGERAVVVGLPGVRVRRGTDVVLEPEVIPAPGAVALMPGGRCAIDARGGLFDVSSAEAARAHRPCEPSRGQPGRARTDVPESVTYPVETAISDEVGCARERTGTVRCWGPILRDRGVVRRDVAVPLAGVDAAQRMVTFGDRICALHRGTVQCWGGSSRDPARGPAAGLPRPISMGTGVTELVSYDHEFYSRGPLCALHADGAVRCWEVDPFAAPREVDRGSLNLHSLVRVATHICALDERSRAWCAALEGFQVFDRDAALDGFERIVVSHGWSFPLRGGSLRCDPAAFDSPVIRDRDSPESWTTGACKEAVRLLPRTVPAPGALRQSTVPSVLGAVEGDDAQAAFREALGGGVAAVPAAGAYHRCELGVNRRVACRWLPIDEFDGPWEVDPHEVVTPDEPVRRIADVDDAVELAVTGDGLACARLGDGRVVCWGRNAGGVLTAAESARAPATYTVEELLARAPSR